MLYMDDCGLMTFPFVINNATSLYLDRSDWTKFTLETKLEYFNLSMKFERMMSKNKMAKEYITFELGTINVSPHVKQYFLFNNIFHEFHIKFGATPTCHGCYTSLPIS